MLPFTTYNIPESPEIKTPQNENWLWIVLNATPATEEYDLLQKIVLALKADMQKDVFLLELNDKTAGILATLPNHNPKLVLSFGVLPTHLGIWIDLQGQGMRVLEKYTFLQTLSLKELLNNALAKKTLWSYMLRFMEDQNAGQGA